MRRLALACLLFVAPAAQSAAIADECDALAANVAQAVGAKKLGKRIGPSIEIRAASGVKLDLTCRGPDPIVQSSSSDPQPSAAYFRDLTAAAQYVVSDSAASVQAALVRAYETALRDRRKSFIQQNGWSASCYTDSGSGLRTLCSIGRIPRG